MISCVFTKLSDLFSSSLVELGWALWCPLSDSKTLLVPAPNQGFLVLCVLTEFSTFWIINFQFRERMMCVIGLAPLLSARLCTLYVQCTARNLTIIKAYWGQLRHFGLSLSETSVNC